MDAQTISVLGDRARKLNDLKQTDGWQELRQVCEERRSDWAQQLARRLLRGEPLDQRKIDHDAGFLAGMKYLLDSPEVSEKTFESALRRANIGDDQA